MEWFRFYHDVIEDPKVQLLPVAMRWRWLEMLCLASRSHHRGVLPSPSEMAFLLRVTEDEVQESIEVLVAAGLFDRKGKALHPHNWEGRQFKSDDVTERSRQHRRNVARNENASASEAEAEADTEYRVQSTEAEAESKPPPVFRLYEELCGSVSPTISSRLLELEADFPEECIVHCFREAALNNGRNLKYVTAILERHAREGCESKSRNGQTPSLTDADLERRRQLHEEKLKEGSR